MYRCFFKRILDLVIAVIAIPFFLLILLVVAPIIYLEDKGSIFYNAPRLGKNKKIYKMFKFRSMRMNAADIRNEDGSTFNSEDDSRLTRIGKFIRKTSLDETPQLFNIIKGDMSFIGPRPDLPEHHELYKGNEERKLEVRPGITGYNQAYFRNTVPWKERIKNDIYYIDHLTLWFDSKVFFKTIDSIVFKKGIFVPTETNSRNGENING